MRFLHTGDLHIGKTVNDFSMLEDQRHILRQILQLAVEKKVQAVLIAGDIYDRSIPPAEAVGVLDDFLTQCAKERIRVLCIAGNHDSPERISFAEQLLEKQGIYMAGSYTCPPRRIRMEDEYGAVDFVLLPFVKPAMAEAGSSKEAVGRLLQADSEADTEAGEKNAGAKRKVLLTHFFVTDGDRLPELSDSETTVNVGGLDNVEAALFADFDYVALGHIHKPQQIGERKVYYAGSPLKYSFSEWKQTKGVNLVELGEKGSVCVEKLPLKPLREMRVIQGKLEDLISPEVVKAADREAYIQARLTNEEELIDPIGTLRTVYPNIMQLILCKNEKQLSGEYETKIARRRKSTAELFADFYQLVKEEEIDEERLQIVEEVCRELQ